MSGPEVSQFGCVKQRQIKALLAFNKLEVDVTLDLAVIIVLGLLNTFGRWDYFVITGKRIDLSLLCGY